MDRDKIYVFGHRNPDTDSVAAAISLAYLKNKLGINAEAAVLSSVNLETKYALNYFNVQPVAKLAGIRELHIGHAIVSRAVFVGLREAVREMKRLMREAQEFTK